MKQLHKESRETTHRTRKKTHATILTIKFELMNPPTTGFKRKFASLKDAQKSLEVQLDYFRRLGLEATGEIVEL